jgi:hypothetical protein
MRPVAQRLVPFAFVGFLLLAVFIFTRGADGQSQPIRKVSAAEVPESQLRLLHKQAHDIGALRQFTWNCQDALGNERLKASVDIWSLPRSVGYRTWVKATWSKRYAGCKRVLQLRTIPSTGDWLTAVHLVQRINPGTERWLLSCSSGEGGHGGFVMNHQGSGAGGWMQFLSSTFYSHYRAAFDDARARGFLIDRVHESWYDPIGQAVTASYMRSHGMSSHWDSRIDYLCA